MRNIALSKGHNLSIEKKNTSSNINLFAEVKDKRGNYISGKAFKADTPDKSIVHWAESTIEQKEKAVAQ